MKASIRSKARGKPFVKGDPRIQRPKNGPLCAEAISFGQNFKNALAKGGDPKELADMLWAKAKQGRPWAADMILAYLIGKPSQPIEGKIDLGVTATSIIEARKLATKEIQ